MSCNFYTHFPHLNPTAVAYALIRVHGAVCSCIHACHNITIVIIYTMYTYKACQYGMKPCYHVVFTLQGEGGDGGIQYYIACQCEHAIIKGAWN